MEPNILIIEDDVEIAHLISLILAKIQLRAAIAYSGTEGLQKMEREPYDLVLLDLMLPGLGGEAVLEHIRSNFCAKVIVISAKSDMSEKVKLLKLGADDYITKPFHPGELEARVEVQLRNHQADRAETILQWRQLKVDVQKRTVYLNDRLVRLTNSEFDLVQMLIRSPERPVSKRKLYEGIWHGTYVGDDNTISVHISNIRKKFVREAEEEYIQTVWGIGFMLV